MSGRVPTGKTYVCCKTKVNTGVSRKKFLVYTYCADKQVADSACSATAYMTGVKGNYMTTGVTAEVKVGDCEAAKDQKNQPSSIIKWAQDAGKATGVVTNTRITHASPSGSYAHIAERNLESDADVLKSPLDPSKCDMDIAKQLVRNEPGKNIKVLLGGGRAKLLPNTTKDPVKDNVFGERKDNLDLINEWMKDKQENKLASATTVYTKDELLNVDPKKTDYLLGLFDPQHMPFYLEANKTLVPSLSEMTKAAIEVLQKEPNGFYLFVEGGRIDIAHHVNFAHLALDETVEFAKAIKTAAQMTSEEDTLLVVTADHSHVMTMAGYPARGTDILKYYGKGDDLKAYMTLSYANGPGYYPEETPGMRHDVTKDDVEKLRYAYPAMVKKDKESHGGDDVAVFARGPWAHLFSGTFEQNYIPIAEAFAAGIGEHQGSNAFTEGGAEILIVSKLLILFTLIYTFIAVR